MNMLLDSGFTRNFVLAQTCTTLGLRIEEEPENNELPLGDGSPVTTQGRGKLHIKCGKYIGMVWARVFPYMQEHVILGMSWLVQEDPDTG